MRRGWGVRFLRKALLAYARRMSPQNMQRKSRQGALAAAQAAARQSAAYRTLLAEAGLSASAIGRTTTLHQLPVLTKDNTFKRFDLPALSRELPNTDIADVLTSSGRGGPGFGFRLTSRQQHDASWFDIDLGLQDVFGVDEKPTLLVNCLPMGVVFSSRAVTVANVSVREDMACAILRDLGPRFEQTLVCTDPLFVRALMRQAQQMKLDWAALNTSFILGEEMLVESQRDFLAARLDIQLHEAESRLVGSSFGVGELGLNLLFETRSTISMRRALRDPALAQQFLPLPAGDAALPSLFCHNPLRCHVEVLNPDPQGWGELCFTMLDTRAVIPLPRFATGDLGRLMPATQVTALCERTSTTPPWLPVVQVRGRIKDRQAGLPSVELVKQWIYSDHAVADALSGAFRITGGGAHPVSLQVQMASGYALDQAERVRLSLARKASVAGFPELRVTYCTNSKQPWGPSLDHERKFDYVPNGDI